MKKKQTESIPESVGGFLKWILGVLTSISIILIFAVMPFYFQEGFTHIGSDKSYFYRTNAIRLGWLILPVFALWLICFAVAAFPKRQKGMLREWCRTVSVTDRLMFLYGAGAVFSYACSRYHTTALWGTKGWYMGLIPQLTLVSIYFLVSRFQFRILSKLLFCAGLAASAAVFFLACLNRFDFWPIPMANSGLPNFISTIGNINWYCGYAVSIGFAGVGLLWLDRGDRRRYTVSLCVYVLLFFATLITQGSDSGIFAMIIVFLALFLCSVREEKGLQLRRFWLLVLLLAGAGLLVMGFRFLLSGRMNLTSWIGDLLTYSPLPVVLIAIAVIGLLWGRTGSEVYRKFIRGTAKLLCIGLPTAAVVFVLMIAVNTVRPGSLGPLSGNGVFTFNDKWASHRGATWSLGIRCFGEQDLLHKLSGIGPDCMADFLYAKGDGKGASEALIARVREAFPNKRLTNAHSELLTILVNMGLLGMLTFGGTLISSVVRWIRARGKSCFAAACGLCVLAYMANNVWSFQQSMSMATIGVVMGMGEWFLRAERK